MRLEDYWGVGPKTSERLREALGEEAAVDAIESADVRALTDAGITRGRATRVLRRANDEAGMDALATRDAREVYDDLLALASEHALTRHAADRIRVLTPLSKPEAVERRLDAVDAAVEAWADLDDTSRDAVVDAFGAYDAAEGTERAAVDAVLALRDAGLDGSTFDALGEIDPDAVRKAADALQHVTPDGVAAGADDRLDDLRARLDDARDLENSAFDVLDRIRETGVRDLTDFRRAFADYVDGETRLSRSALAEVAPDEAHDAADFVSTALRALVDDLERRVAEREREVEDDLRASIADARDDVDRAVAAVDDVAFDLSLARFAAAYDLVRPTLGGDGLAVEGARNLFLDDPDPIDYAVGDHDLSPPADDRVAVLTGANSGGKTTLLETCCSVALLAAMGLPVPAERAAVGEFDAVVFHRRHASFNAGVLESTLKSIVPPLTDGGRTLMLVDEFEAITEPGRAADLLNGLVDLTVERGALGVYVTHLADDLSPLPDAARIDGIFAEGLTSDLDLRVDYQPRFGTVGKSTPEFIVSRLVANAGDRRVQRGFEHLAAAVGEEAVQRTLSEVWEG
ncbi:MAG: DNA mismatch repair protein [Haloplanus sp.]